MAALRQAGTGRLPRIVGSRYGWLTTAGAVPFTKQTLLDLRVSAVKGLADLEVDFAPTDSMVTGVFGPNGCGKSTILHLLACSFKPAGGGDLYRFSDFFLPTSAHLWSGSAFAVTYSHQETFAKQAPNPPSTHVRSFEKKHDRWTPKYEKRHPRECYYLGVRTCVPRIESESRTSRVNFTAKNQQARQEVLAAARTILNRDYSSYEEYVTGDGTKYIGVTGPTGSYTELSMGAGEQRVFKILEAVHRAEKYALILIDEVDLLLHERALLALAEHLRSYCSQKAIQVVFTAHRHSLLGVPGINFRHIMQTPKRTFCLSRTTPDALTQLTTAPVRPFRIFVEDDLAEALVSKLVELRGARRYAVIARFGSAMNAFTLAAAAALTDVLTEDDLFVLDGDVFRSIPEREGRMKQVVSGDDPVVEGKRARALGAVRQLTLPAGVKPEAFIWGVLRAQDATVHAGCGGEIIRAAQEVFAVDDSHAYVNSILARTGYERGVGLLRVADALALTGAWAVYVSELDSWLEGRLAVLHAPAAGQNA